MSTVEVTLRYHLMTHHLVLICLTTVSVNDSVNDMVYDSVYDLVYDMVSEVVYYLFSLCIYRGSRATFNRQSSS